MPFAVQAARLRSLVPLVLTLFWASGCGSTAVERPIPEQDGAADTASADTGRDTGGGDVDACSAVDCPFGEVCLNGICVAANIDTDQDGFPIDVDCNDLDPTSFPGATERCDGWDNDCDAQIDEDFDQDADTYPTCASLGRESDCDDSNPQVYPGAPEVCDGTDNNCNDTVDEGSDNDRDGYSACQADASLVDCDDDDPLMHPGADERCNNVDDNCDGVVDEGTACVGCSDGQRDELTDMARWHTVAACKGTFGRNSLRATRTNTACGDDLGVTCPTPEDLCAPGWHICMRNGFGADLRFRLTAAECRAVTGVYVAASNNCSNPASENPATTACDMSEPLGCYPSGWCSAPVACGSTETTHCAHAVWVNATRIFGLHAGTTDNNGCGSIASSTDYSSYSCCDRIAQPYPLTGVLCCAD